MLITVAIGSVSTYYQKKAVDVTLLPRGKKPIVVRPWWRSLPILTMLALNVTCWIPYLLMIRPSIPDDGSDQKAVLGWGNMPDQPLAHVTVDGNYLEKYASNYRLVALAYLMNPLIQERDTQGLQKSGAYDIEKGKIVMGIPLNGDFLLKEAAASGSNFALLLIPRGLTAQSFSSIHEAQRAGAKFLWKGSASFKLLNATISPAEKLQ